MKHSIDEIMLQRCVDGELSDRERAELLSRLHEQGTVENWKTLALSFVEHQVFSKVFADDGQSGEILSFQLAHPSIPEVNAGDRSTTPPARTPLIHRRVRPWFSIAASLAVGLLTGVGGHFFLNRNSEPEPLVVMQSPMDVDVMNSPESYPLIHHTPPITTAHSPMMNVHLTGLGRNQDEPVSVPVYSPDQWQSLQQQQPPVVLTEEVLRNLEAHGLTVERERQWFRARLQDGREILVPTETVRVRHAVQ